MVQKPKQNPPAIGWREWVRLPDLGVPHIKAKVDSGARSSSIHASEIEEFERDGQAWLRFRVHTDDRHDEEVVLTEAAVLDFRSVRSSSGVASKRYVIQTHVELMGERWPIELTLANRQKMGFRMLLGREAFRRRFVVDAGRSFVCGRFHKPTRSRKKRTRGKANP